jgi:2,3-bisphosphoglycerate-dependent phosphoglycerate mutase
MNNNGKLILIRHTESEWNELGKWTGFTDIHLSFLGLEKAKKIGEKIKNINIDMAFDSALVRSQETLNTILDLRNDKDTILVENIKELNERDYGEYTGKNKWQMKELLGEEQFLKIRRSWDYPIPNGETLKMVYERTIPFFINRILPLLKDKKDVLIVAHGNSLRSIIKYIENISDEDISKIEIDFGFVLIYNLDDKGKIIKKEIIKI